MCVQRAVVIAIFVAFGITSGCGKDDVPVSQRTEALRKYGLDPDSPFESRIKDATASVLKDFTDDGNPPPTPHILTARERRQLAAAFATLPALHRRVLREHLRGLIFLDGMPNTARAATLNPKDGFRLFDITFRAGVFSETVSTFLTAKERTCFSAAGSALTVSIDAGTLDAIVYVLLHEATHIVDDSRRFTPGSFSAGVWSGRTTAIPEYRDSLLESIRFRTGVAMPIDRAEAVYAALRKTPFVSLYASSNWFDDLAESVTWYHLSTEQAQSYRIVIRRGDHEIFSYEPLKSPAVRARFPRLGQFFEGGR